MHKTIFSLSIILLTLFTALTFAAKYNLTTQLDFDSTVKIQDKMPLRLQPYLINFVTIGNWQIMSILVFISMLLQPKRFWLIGILYICIAGIEIYGKYELHHPPPPQFMTLRFQNLNLPQHFVREAQSYPSGHAARAAFLSFLWVPLIITFISKYINQISIHSTDSLSITLPFGFKLTKAQFSKFSIQSIFLLLLGATFLILSLLLCLSIGFIKIYLGEHWLSDVLAGWLLGAGLALLSQSFPSMSLNHQQQPSNHLQGVKN